MSVKEQQNRDIFVNKRLSYSLPIAGTSRKMCCLISPTLIRVREPFELHPFELMEVAEMKFVSPKSALLLALTTAKQVCDLQALSIRPSDSCCLKCNPLGYPDDGAK